MKILKILLPFFPNNDYLQKHWWHRLVLVITIIISIVSILTFVFFTLATITDYRQAQRVEQIVRIMNIEEFYKIKPQKDYGLLKPSASELGQSIKEKYPQYNEYSDWNLGSAALKKYELLRNDWGMGTWIDVVYFDNKLLIYAILAIILGLLAPNIIYRAILYIATGNEWKKSKIGKND